jgi:hypothetical protein
MKKNKKNIIIATSLVIILVVIIILCVKNNNSNSKEKEMNDKINSLVKEYYEDYLYNQIGTDYETRTEALKGYEQTGLNVSIYNLIRITNSKQLSEIEKIFVNPDTNEKCDLNNSDVFIYPKSPYNKEDYEIKINLNCGGQNGKSEDK